LQEINAELEAFSYSISHDLKAPLSRAENWLYIFQHEFRAAIGEKGLGMLLYVRSEISAMQRMIEAMLVLSRIARSNIERVEVDLALKANEIMEQLRAENSEAVIAFSVPEHAVVYADRELLHILLRNLLENAIKFSKGQNPIRIEMGCTRAGQDVLCFVRDNGVGFDMRYADKLFAPFQRLHTQAEFPGTGIGLATAQRIVHRHGGKIWAESEPGKGTTIYFTLSGAEAKP
jgi:light-regulated signal transduction histidine kinase (bacteriophytochrome)